MYIFAFKDNLERGKMEKEGRGEEYIPICNAESPLFRAWCLISCLPSCSFSLRMNEESSSLLSPLSLGSDRYMGWCWVGYKTFSPLRIVLYQQMTQRGYFPTNWSPWQQSFKEHFLTTEEAFAGASSNKTEAGQLVVVFGFVFVVLSSSSAVDCFLAIIFPNSSGFCPDSE